jgi:hypothetical protein
MKQDREDSQEKSAMDHKIKPQGLLLDSFGEMVQCYREQITAADKADLDEWENANLGTGLLGTSDWPGWKKYLTKRPGNQPRLVAALRRRA